MECRETVKKAKKIIGEKLDDDYRISPTDHRERYREKSRELYEILGSSKLESAARRYEDEDGQALDAQDTFNTVFKRTNITVLITAFIISAILALGILATNTTTPPENYILGGLGIASVIVGALATKDFQLMRRGELLENWMTARANAESIRLEYFEKLADEKVQGRSEPAHFNELLKLEYFRRYQLEVQLDYYLKRSKDHKRDSSRYLKISGWATAGSAIAAGSATFGILGEKWTAIAAFGAVFAAMSSYASVHEGVYQYRRNGERYRRTARTLEKLYERLDDVREAVCLAGYKPLAEYVEAVHEQLSLEHRQWLGQLNESIGAYARLEKTLKDILAENPG